MIDRLLFIMAIAGILVLPWQRGDEPVEYERSAWVEPACTFLPGDWPATYNEICEESE